MSRMGDKLIDLMNAERELGPCPFCDSEEVWYEPTHDDGTVWLMCPACGWNWKGDICD